MGGLPRLRDGSQRGAFQRWATIVVKFLRLNLRAKLLLAFATVMIVLAGAPFVATQCLVDFDQAVHQITDERLPWLEMVHAWVVEVLQTARHTRNMLILEDKAKIQDELDALVESKRLRARYMDELEAAVDTPAERSLLQAVVDARAAYVPSEDDYMRMVSANQLKEAKELLLGQTRPTQLKYLDQLNRFSAYEAAQIKAAATALDSSYRDTRRLISAVAALAAAVAILVAFSVTSAITKPIRSAVTVLQAIEKGRYDTPVPRGSHDETGRLLIALDSMQRNLKERVERERNAAAENSSQLGALNRVQAVVEFDLEGKVITANDNFLRATGYALHEIKGHHHNLFVDPAYSASEEYRSFWQKLVRGEYDAGQYEGFGKNGKEFWLEASYNPVLNGEGKPFKIVNYATDVTTQLRASRQMQEAVRQTQDVVKAADAGDLTRRLTTEGTVGDLRAMTEGVNCLLQGMSDLVRQIKQAAAEVHRGAQEISSGNSNLSQRTVEQSASLEETASSMEQMTCSVKANANHAVQANQLAAAACEQAQQGGAVVEKAVIGMSGINESSNKIADIIGVIDEMAFRTNLLALNAAVEAARAGEQGRGFAVVASEVRNLAGRSATAAKEIKQLIQESVRKVDEGSLLVTQSGRTLELIVASVKKVADIVREITASCRDQSSGIEQVNQAVAQLDQMTQDNAALVEQSSAASRSMAGQARALSETIERYRVAGDADSGELPADASESAKSIIPLPRRSLRGSQMSGRNALTFI